LINFMFYFFKKIPRLNYQLIIFVSKIIPPNFLEKISRWRAVSITQFVIKKVPAYQRFLEEQGTIFKKIKSFDDFKKIPLTDKKNYFLKYKTEDSLIDRSILDIYSLEQSGNYDYKTGSIYWPRFPKEERKSLTNLEFLFRYLLGSHQKRTLVIVAFPLGMWASGEKLCGLIKQIAKKRAAKMTVATPGINKETIVELIKKVGQFYERIILFGNLYFLRRVVELGEKEGIDWHKYDIYLLTGAEGFPENLREFVRKKIAHEKDFLNPLVPLRIISLFGMTETSGAIAVETPIAILTRRLAWQDSNFKKLLFGKNEALPLIFQYNPIETYLEIVNEELVITKLTEQPLLRYNSHDMAEIFTFKRMIDVLKKTGHDVEKLLKFEGYSKNSILPLPFLFIFGRSKNIIKIEGITFTVDDLKEYLSRPELIESNTGNFKMDKIENEDKSERLCLTIELLGGIKLSQELIKKYQDVFFNSVPQIKFFLKQYSDPPEQMEPRIQLIERGRGPFSLKEEPKYRHLKKQD